MSYALCLSEKLAQHRSVLSWQLWSYFQQAYVLILVSYFHDHSKDTTPTKRINIHTHTTVRNLSKISMLTMRKLVMNGKYNALTVLQLTLFYLLLISELTVITIAINKELHNVQFFIANLMICDITSSCTMNFMVVLLQKNRNFLTMCSGRSNHF